MSTLIWAKIYVCVLYIMQHPQFPFVTPMRTFSEQEYLCNIVGGEAVKWRQIWSLFCIYYSS